MPQRTVETRNNINTRDRPDRNKRTCPLKYEIRIIFETDLSGMTEPDNHLMPSERNALDENWYES